MGFICEFIWGGVYDFVFSFGQSIFRSRLTDVEYSLVFIALLCDASHSLVMLHFYCLSLLKQNEGNEFNRNFS